MKLDIDTVTEGKIRHYRELLDEMAGSVGDDFNEVNERLKAAALLIANAIAVKLNSEDVLKKLKAKRQDDVVS